MPATMNDVSLEELALVDGGINWECVAIWTFAGAAAGAAAGPIGAVIGAAAGFAAGLGNCGDCEA